MGYELTTLVENTVATSFGLLAEHGQSILIEGEGRMILFDTGQGGALLNNAEKLEKDLSKVDTVVLSHGHYDHTLGLAKLLDVTTDFELIVHPDAFAPKVAIMPGPQFRPIGMALTRDDLEKRGVRLRIVEEPTEVAPGIMTSGVIPMNTDFESIEPILMVQSNGDHKPDPLADDLSLFVDTDKGLVVILGCAHRGVINILNQARAVMGDGDVFAVIGGLHLVRAQNAQIQRTIEELNRFGVRKIGASHCTGQRAMAAFYHEMEDRILPNFVGARLVI